MPARCTPTMYTAMRCMSVRCMSMRHTPVRRTPKGVGKGVILSQSAKKVKIRLDIHGKDTFQHYLSFHQSSRTLCMQISWSRHYSLTLCRASMKLVVWPQPSSHSPSGTYTCACIAPPIVGKGPVLTETESALITLVRRRVQNTLQRSNRLVPKRWLCDVRPVRCRWTRKGSRGRPIASYGQSWHRVRSQIIESI